MPGEMPLEKRMIGGDRERPAQAVGGEGFGGEGGEHGSHPFHFSKRRERRKAR